MAFSGSTFWKFFLPGGNNFLWRVVAIGIYAGIVVWVDEHHFPAKKIIEASAAMFSGVVMGLLLVFRTNSAYDRWWEGRKLWGQLLNDLRNLSIKCKEYVAASEEEKAEFANKLSAFGYALKDHLREETHAIVKGTTLARSKHVPMELARQIFEQMRAWQKAGCIDSFDLLQMDRHMSSLMDICGACERIVKSPIAGSYKMIIWMAIILYFATLPWILVPQFDMWTVVIIIVNSYFLIGLELLAEEVERPFGIDPNDLPLESMCDSIRKSVKQALQKETLTLVD